MYSLWNGKRPQQEVTMKDYKVIPTNERIITIPEIDGDMIQVRDKKGKPMGIVVEDQFGESKIYRIRSTKIPTTRTYRSIEELIVGEKEFYDFFVTR